MVREMKYFLTHLTIQFLDILTADEDGGDGGGTHEDENDESMEYEQNPDCRTRVANESSKENCRYPSIGLHSNGNRSCYTST